MRHAAAAAGQAASAAGNVAREIGTGLRRRRADQAATGRAKPALSTAQAKNPSSPTIRPQSP